MQEQVAADAGRAGLEAEMLGNEAATAAYFGRLEKARTLSRLAVHSAERAEQPETAAGHEADAALREALFGIEIKARQGVVAALSLASGPDVQYRAALTLALAGDEGGAGTLADDLKKRFPEDTIVQYIYLPTLHAQLALESNEAGKAIESLLAALPYEPGVGLYPAYIRGLAHLANRQGREAAAEFKKILGHRGIVVNSPIGALARLQLGRALMMQGDMIKARDAYRDFLWLWKDADPDVPVLAQAKAELTKLNR
jgi:hypothetical protein